MQEEEPEGHPANANAKGATRHTYDEDRLVRGGMDHFHEIHLRDVYDLGDKAAQLADGPRNSKGRRQLGPNW